MPKERNDSDNTGSGIQRAADISETSPRSNDDLRFGTRADRPSGPAPRTNRVPQQGKKVRLTAGSQDEWAEVVSPAKRTCSELLAGKQRKNRLLRVKPILGLAEDSGRMLFEDLFRDFLSAVGRQAM